MVDLVCGVDVIARGLRELNARPCVSVDVDAEFVWGLLVESGFVERNGRAALQEATE